MAVPHDLIELGRLQGAYGVRGWMKVAPLSPDADALRSVALWWLMDAGGEAAAAIGVAAHSVTVRGLRRHGGGLVVKFDGYDAPEQANALRGRRVGVARTDFPVLPPGQFYWLDLIGARVVNRQGQILGAVRGLRSNGVHDVLEIEEQGQGADDGAGDCAGAVTQGDPVQPRRRRDAQSAQARATFLLPLVAQYVDGIDTLAGPAPAADGERRVAGDSAQGGAGAPAVRLVRVDWDPSWL